MKKTAILAFLVLALFITGCGNERSGTAGTGTGTGTSIGTGIIEIRETMFITQIREINLNHRDYLGRTLRFEGMFRYFELEGNNYFFVIRNTPGCCGDDGEIGFEVSWDHNFQGFDDGSRGITYPNRNDWVEVRGVLSSYENFGRTFLYVALSELNILETRGLEFVVR